MEQEQLNANLNKAKLMIGLTILSILIFFLLYSLFALNVISWKPEAEWLFLAGPLIALLLLVKSLIYIFKAIGIIEAIYNSSNNNQSKDLMEWPYEIRRAWHFHEVIREMVNPLNGIKSTSQVLEEEFGYIEAIRDYCYCLQNHVERQNQVIKTLAFESVSEFENMRPVKVINGIAICHNQYPKNILLLEVQTKCATNKLELNFKDSEVLYESANHDH